MTAEPSLAALLIDTAAGIPGVVTRAAAGGHEFVAGGSVVASVGEDGAEFQLDPAVVRAALSTPDTRSVGADRIAFAPAELDRYAIDRATAWLASAVRRAIG